MLFWLVESFQGTIPTSGTATTAKLFGQEPSARPPSRNPEDRHHRDGTRTLGHRATSTPARMPSSPRTRTPRSSSRYDKHFVTDRQVLHLERHDRLRGPEDHECDQIDPDQGETDAPRRHTKFVYRNAKIHPSNPRTL